MSRSSYSDDMDDPLALGRWRGAVLRAIRGKRGQALLRDMLTALDAMPEKRLDNNLIDSFKVIFDSDPRKMAFRGAFPPSVAQTPLADQAPDAGQEAA